MTPKECNSAKQKAPILPAGKIGKQEARIKASREYGIVCRKACDVLYVKYRKALAKIEEAGK